MEGNLPMDILLDSIQSSFPYYQTRKPIMQMLSNAMSNLLNDFFLFYPTPFTRYQWILPIQLLQMNEPDSIIMSIRKNCCMVFMSFFWITVKQQTVNSSL